MVSMCTFWVMIGMFGMVWVGFHRICVSWISNFIVFFGSGIEISSYFLWGLDERFLKIPEGWWGWGL